MKVLILHGPNLNLLGTREPELYGKESLEEINRAIQGRAGELGVEIVGIFQTNSEYELIEKIHSESGNIDGLVFNPAAFTHTSVALRDALLATGIPFVEVHLSNVSAREPFRQRSFFSDISVGVVTGFGSKSYLLALEGLVHAIGEKR